MSSKDDIIQFLKNFHEKKKVFSILFRDDRSKNLQTLLDLEISPKKREEIIDSLTYKEYSDGPFPDALSGIGDLWVFGCKVKSEEIYIKISMGKSSAKTICISFHIAEHEMSYPFKKENK